MSSAEKPTEETIIVPDGFVGDDTLPVVETDPSFFDGHEEPFIQGGYTGDWLLPPGQEPIDIQINER